MIGPEDRPRDDEPADRDRHDDVPRGGRVLHFDTHIRAHGVDDDDTRRDQGRGRCRHRDGDFGGDCPSDCGDGDHRSSDRGDGCARGDPGIRH